MSDPGDGRSFARMLRVSILVLFLEAALAMVLGVVFGDTGQPEPGEERVSALSLLLLPFLPLMALLPAAAVSAVIVLPAVLLGEELARRIAGRPLWWQLLLSVASGALLLPLAGGWGWLVAAVVIAAAALITRHAVRGYFVSVLLWGTLAVLTVFMLGGIGLYSGLIKA
ncbi:hypothetical protein ACN9M0_21245 [Streptomyces sp. R-07]|uniref:hypothetical protein n=1 Tax=Streptomyces sp. R-07 TaxID=3404052 RepID=UPI003CF40F2A